MANKMLIDATHPEETRVVVLRGNRVEEFDFESASKRQLRGNIYLAKVTRVEPSLQAAFIEYGGNRHGFLAFSEIHPDYYQIPVADRQALLEDEARSHSDEEEEQPRSSGHRRSRRFRRNGRNGGERQDGSPDAPGQDFATGRPEVDPGEPGVADREVASEDTSPEFGFADADPVEEGATLEATSLGSPGEALEPGGIEPEVPAGDAQPMRAVASDEVVSEPADMDEPSGSVADAIPSIADSVDAMSDAAPEDVTTLQDGYEAEIPTSDTEQAPGTADDDRAEIEDESGDPESAEHEPVELGGGDAMEEVPSRFSRPRRHYKIQEVIKRRQILLVQVVKEERGNKGAALTTYLSLAGRYSVLMPNTARGGGISRKITDSDDRKRLKAIAQELEVPDGMGIILRTAGAARGIAEVKRDFEYLLRMWETVRETTLNSSAPMLVYEEGSLIKRSIRDLYGKEIDEVLVAGDDGYREAREFMRLLMPSHARNVIAYRDPQPIFVKSGVEAQLDAMFSNHVTLKSGGYLVINQTEALVAIDVNSGRSTREHNIEDTALRTNLEAADEVARQLRLRDLAGLIVVDFIDMEEGRNDRAVERRIKDALKDDRARIQIGRISHFGLLEMSRQRIRTGVLEGSTVLCPHCGGAGTVRSVSSIALHILRLVEDGLIKSASNNPVVRTRAEVAFYILNQKRSSLLDLEMRFGVSISIMADPLMTGTVYHAIERGAEATPPTMPMFRPNGATAEALPFVEEDEADEVFAEETEDEVAGEAGRTVQVRDGQSGEGRNGEGRNGEGRDGEGRDGEDGRRKRRRRRRRGGRGEVGGRSPGDETQPLEAGSGEEADSVDGGEPNDEAFTDEIVPIEDVGVEVTSSLALDDMASPVAAPVDVGMADAPPTASTGETEAVAEAPRRRRTRRSRADDATDDAGVTAPRRPRRSRARLAETDADEARPSADIDIEADTAKTHPADADAEAAAVEASAVFAEPELPLTTDAAPAPSASPPDDGPNPSPASTEPPGPPQPKRSGWWQRAKATFTQGS